MVTGLHNIVVSISLSSSFQMFSLTGSFPTPIQLMTPFNQTEISIHKHFFCLILCNYLDTWILPHLNILTLQIKHHNRFWVGILSLCSFDPASINKAVKETCWKTWSTFYFLIYCAASRHICLYCSWEQLILKGNLVESVPSTHEADVRK